MPSSTKLKAAKKPEAKSNGKVKMSKKDATKKDAPKKVVSKKAESSSDDSDSSEEETPVPKAKVTPAKAKKVENGKAKAVKKPVTSSSESSEDSSEEEEEKPKAAQVKTASSLKKVAESSDSDSDGDAPAPVQSGPKTLSAKKSSEKESSSESSEDDSSEDDVPPKPPAKQTPAKSSPAKPVAKKDDSDDSSEEESEDEFVAPAFVEVAKNEESSDDESDDSSEEDVQMTDAAAPAPQLKGKRKADEDLPAATKKAKADGGEAVPSDDSGETKTVFVGRLSWNVDNDWLASEFAECGEVVSARVQMDRNTGKSRGFAYVTFSTSEAVEAALKMSGKEIDGRPVNIDKSIEKDKSAVREKRAQAFGDSTSPPSAVLFVGNLDFHTSEDSVWEKFGEFGEVKSVRLPTDRESGRPKGFGYVEFVDVDTAKKAFEGLAGAEIDGRAVRLDYSQPRDGGSGGFGGGRGGGRGGFGGGRGGFGGDRGRGGRGGRGGGRGRGGDRGRGGRGGPRTGGIQAFEGRKTTFD